MITRIPAELEIDHERGVIYVHLTDKKKVKELGTQTALRICGLPRPIPQLNERMLDINVAHSLCDWEGTVWSEGPNP